VPQPALFLDRDGVVNVDSGYVYRKEDFIFIEGIFSLVRTARKAGYLIVIITNQAGIGRGYYDEKQFHTLMQWVKEQFQRNDADLDAVYYCPDHPEHGIGVYKRDTGMRKPGPGMLLQAAQEHDIDLSASVMIGDSYKDMAAGETAGVGMLFYFGSKTCPPGARKISSLRDAEQWLLPRLS
jgi:D-glycero-D-manno-heptose 1,7-bisphosphate phosphatase